MLYKVQFGLSLIFNFEEEPASHVVISVFKVVRVPLRVSGIRDISASWVCPRHYILGEDITHGGDMYICVT